MEIKIIFKLDQLYLPKDYHSTFYSFLKQALEANNNELYSKYFSNKEALVKNFSFYLKLSNPNFEKDKIKIDNPLVTMSIRDYDRIELFEIYNAFLKSIYKKFAMNLNQAQIIRVKLTPLKEIEGKTIFIKMLSPLVVKKQINKEQNKTWYYTYEDEEFLLVLKDNIESSIKKLGYKFDLNDLKIIPIKNRKTVISLYSINIPVTLGTFIIEANEDVLNFLYNAGIGALRSSGCGSFQILGSD